MTNNTTAPALTDEQRAAINMAISVLTPLAMDEYGDALRALLTSPRAAVPEGWKLVPIVPTRDMLECLWDGLPKGSAFHNCTPLGIYAAMLDAAPVAPVAPVAEYDGNHVQNHCTECGAHEAECSCAQAVAADGAAMGKPSEIERVIEERNDAWAATEAFETDLAEILGTEPGSGARDRIYEAIVSLKRAAVSPATAEPDEVRAHVKWLHSCLRDAGYCIDVGKCHHECGSKGDCFRQAGCVPLTGSHLSDDWTLPVASEPATAEPTDYAAIEREHFGDPERAALREMLDDARNEFTMVREALGVAYEPHQTLFERTLDAARASQAAAPAEAREITMTVEDAMRIVMANWGDKDAIERVFRANVAPADAGEAVASDPIAALIERHAEELDRNDYAYFELAYTRQTGWMAWITDRPAQGEPGTPAYAKSRKVILRGSGGTAVEACQDALNAAAQGAQGGKGGEA
ncbi:hypothetical protein [Burkholderia glumae]|uniref:hypothetical protein n=1 Tax=Burkholderia glumae TaxID=337 RepID=UPI003B99854E